MKILAIDPGDKRIGIALSDPTGKIATPLTIIKHVSRPLDAAEIANLAQENKVERIIIGTSSDENGFSTPASRRADRLAEAIRLQSEIPIVMWDESFSTQEARHAQIELGTTRRRRHGHMDDLAAAIILQSYLDSNLDL